MCLVLLQQGTDLYESQLGGKDYVTGFAQPSPRTQSPDSLPLLLLVGTPITLGPELAYNLPEHSLHALWRRSLDILNILFYHLRCMCTDCYDICVLLGCSSVIFIRIIIYKCVLWITQFCGKSEG